ncbi:MAG: DMT family protein [Calothrix sp. SM1_5_4]|nr:DMT family protein [Calothrix sp. SM1_5_4]
MIPLQTIGLLILSNIFMTFAWYGHLKFKSAPLLTVILISWGLAFFEYCLQVPANRIGSGYFSAPQLKVIQEAVTFSVFGVFSVLYLKDRPTFYDLFAFALIFLAVAISVFQPKG